MSKVLFFDVDGTLILNHQGVHEIDGRVIEKLKEIKAQGNHLFIATGRPYAFVNDYMKSLDFDGFVMANGSHVIVGEQNIFEKNLGYGNVKRLVEFLEANSVEYILQDNTYGYIKPHFSGLLEFYRTATINEANLVFEFDDSVFDQIIKMEVNMPKGMEAKFVELLGDDFNYDYNGAMDYFEIYDKDITKAQGIEKTLEFYNLKIEDSYAFGDGYNDIDMIKAVGCGVVMGNGVDELKEIADYITDDFMDDGLLKALNKFFD